MNILYIGHENQLNGASKSMLNLIDSFSNNNNIYVLTCFREGPFLDELKKRNVEIVYSKFYRCIVEKKSSRNWFKKKLLWFLHDQFVNFISAVKLTKYVQEKKIDIIHSNTSVINLGETISKLSKIPHVQHIREFGDLDFHMYPLYSKALLSRYMNNYCDYFICISKAIYNYYSYLDPKKKRLIYNGVDKSNLIKKNYIKKNNDIVHFLITGRISEAKGQDIAIDACQILLDRGLNNFELNIAGNGILEENHSTEVLKKVHLLGFQKDMSIIRKNNDVELICSRAEAFGRVTAEAMMSGLPVIGSNSGGTPELIINGRNGFLFDPGNINDLADKMEFFIKHQEMIKSIGKEAQKYASEHFSIELCAQKIFDLYKSLVMR